MSKPDQAHQQTDKELHDLERRIATVYREAKNDLQQTVEDYFSFFAERDKAMKEKLQNGDITETYYLQWRLNQIGRGERFEALRDTMAERYTNANKVALAYVNDATPSVYALNRNYAAYTLEKATGMVGFTLFDESTVKRLLKKSPDLMPNYPEKKALKRNIDLKWGKKQITAAVTSGILQGKSVGRIADDLQANIEKMNRSSAVRAARTAVTGAQNAGRQDSYEQAMQMGIEMQKEWVATLDGRTRHSHRRLDGEVVGYDEEFSNGCRYPGDPRGKPAEVYNCRCTVIAKIKGVREAEPVKRKAVDIKTGESILVEKMSYEQWEALKNGEKYDLKTEGEEAFFNRELLMQAKEMTQDIISSGYAAEYGLRAQVDDTEKLGEIMVHKSMNFGGDFEGEEDEFEELPGVSTISVNNIDLTSDFGGYEGRVLYLLGADSSRGGYDPGERILKDPVVLAKMRVQNGTLILAEKVETDVSEDTQEIMFDNLEENTNTSKFAGSEKQVEEYLSFKAEMEAKYGADAMWLDMDDAEYSKLERLERIAYKGE